MKVRANWRIILLVVLILASAIVLFVPGATLGSSGPSGGGATNDTIGNVSADPNVTTGDGLTNLQYGIQLEGGSRIRAPIVGMMVEDVAIEGEDFDAVEEDIAERLSIPVIDVEIRDTEPKNDGRYVVEMFNASVSDDEFASALSGMGYAVSAGDVQDRVSDPTRDEIIEVINLKVGVSALSGVNVYPASTPTGDYFIVIESVGRDVSDLRSILRDRGVVDVYAFYQEGGNWTRTHVLDQDAFKSVGSARPSGAAGDGQQEWAVAVTLTDEAAGPFQERMRQVGFDQPRNCDEGPRRGPVTGCMQTELNGEIIFNASWDADLAQSIDSGDFATKPTFSMTAPDQETIRNLEISLKTGQPLPAPLDLSPDAAQTTQLEPSLAEQFKANSVIVGLAAVLTVSLVVYYRYRDARVAVPMVVTALSEVFLLLGFVALVQYPLNLAHIAGFIAVIGTGVDDLVIIADEILQREGVATGRVFRNRFRKAFWVIAAAAATTILAMSPLMVLSLGDLSGFAIITIVGVLIGVGITRPAYGDILRNLILGDEGGR